MAAVIADRAARTPKYLYGVTRGCHILKPAHLQARSTHCREAADVGRFLVSAVPMQAQAHTVAITITGTLLCGRVWLV